MRLSLRWLVPALLIAFIGILSVWNIQYQGRLTEQEVEASVTHEINLLMTRMQHIVSHEMLESQLDTAQEIISALGSDPRLEIAVLIDDTGKTLASTRLANVGNDSRHVLHSTLATDVSDHIDQFDEVKGTLTGKLFLEKDGVHLTGIYPVLMGWSENNIRPDRLGILFAHYDISHEKAARLVDTRKGILQFSSVLIILSLALGMFLYGFVTRRITDITNATASFAAGNLQARTGLAGHDEIGAVGKAVDNMLEMRAKVEKELAENHRKVELALEGTIQAIAHAVEVRDPYTAGHQGGVTNLACAIAADMGLNKEQIKGIRMGASIHDIGKIYLPADILNKPSKLSDIEYAIVKEHPSVGYEILKEISFPWPVAEIAHQHHERMDGSGYPQGLKGDEICLEARIVGVADVVEAMANHRPYRPALGLFAALEYIKENSGSAYDPVVVDTCVRLFEEKRFEFS